MPRAVKSTLRKTQSLPASLPRRKTSDAERRRARREILGIPGLVDQWLAANRAKEIGEPDCPLSKHEVRCFVQVVIQKGEEEGDFVDPDTYMLHLTITALHTTGVPGSYIVFPKIVLESYTGWNTSVNAPDWTQWTAGRTVVFRQTREELLQFFLSVAPKQDGMDVLAKGIESIRI